MATRTNKRGYWAIVGNGPWGLWFGRVIATDAEIAKTHSVRLFEARSIRHWYGRKGGITSLARYGLCGPRMTQSRVGGEAESTLLLEVKAVHLCSAAAAATFRACRCDDEC